MLFSAKRNERQNFFTLQKNDDDYMRKYFNKFNLANFINFNFFFRTREKDGFDRSRFEHTQQLSRYFQEHLKKSQNPDKCEDARFLVSQVK